jgi:hypothetical protein
VLVGNLPGAVVLVVTSARRRRADLVSALPEEPQLAKGGVAHG